MIGKVNIPRQIQDSNYRYQMPLLQQRTEGKGINIHTTLLNLKEVAKSLLTSHEYILKFFGYELALQTNEKNSDIWINGEIDKKTVLEVLDKFIDKFILCSRCKLPEMFIRPNSEKNFLEGVCYSCGATTEIDRGHKLSGYILKYPPQNQSEFKKRKEENMQFGIKPSESSRTGADSKRSEIDESTLSSDALIKLQFNKKRRELFRLIRENAFIPFSVESASVFEEVNKYLNEGFLIRDKYTFAFEHVEIVYKLVKRLRLEKEKWDRIGYILFCYIFNNKPLDDMEGRLRLFVGVLERHNLSDYAANEFILNLEWYLYKVYTEKDIKKKIPTVMKKFYDAKIFTEVTLLGVFRFMGN